MPTLPLNLHLPNLGISADARRLQPAYTRHRGVLLFFNGPASRRCRHFPDSFDRIYLHEFGRSLGQVRNAPNGAFSAGGAPYFLPKEVLALRLAQNRAGTRVPD